jgi:hypothetical protein
MDDFFSALKVLFLSPLQIDLLAFFLFLFLLDCAPVISTFGGTGVRVFFVYRRDQAAKQAVLNEPEPSSPMHTPAAQAATASPLPSSASGVVDPSDYARLLKLVWCWAVVRDWSWLSFSLCGVFKFLVSCLNSLPMRDRIRWT